MIKRRQNSTNFSIQRAASDLLVVFFQGVQDRPPTGCGASSPSESQVLIPARKRGEIDWDAANRLATENRDFLEYVKLVKQFYQTGEARLVWCAALFCTYPSGFSSGYRQVRESAFLQQGEGLFTTHSSRSSHPVSSSNAGVAIRRVEAVRRVD